MLAGKILVSGALALLTGTGAALSGGPAAAGPGLAPFPTPEHGGRADAAPFPGLTHGATVKAPRWCPGRVAVNALNVRSGPGLKYRVVGSLSRGDWVTTDLNTAQQVDGYRWVKRANGTWIADRVVATKKWYVTYEEC